MVNEKRRLWKLLLFTLPTLGIYNIVFWYRFTKDLNEMNREEKKIKNYILVCFLSIITLGIYRWVWLFYLEDRIQVTGEQMGIKIHPGPGIILFFWTFGKFVLFGPLLADLFIIRNMNKIAREYNASFSKKTKVINPSGAIPDTKAIAKEPAAVTTNTQQPAKQPVTPNNQAAAQKPIAPNNQPVAQKPAVTPTQQVPQKPVVPNQQKPVAPNNKPVAQKPSAAAKPEQSGNRSQKVNPEKKKVVNKQVISPNSNTKQK
ncbi:MAG: DUF4234 domain-containing protein [Eubacteriales bacterium]|nr:DUF4234 domain-containing protein [Eubacteriales bacterium]